MKLNRLDKINIGVFVYSLAILFLTGFVSELAGLPPTEALLWLLGIALTASGLFIVFKSTILFGLYLYRRAAAEEVSP